MKAFKFLLTIIAITTALTLILTVHEPAPQPSDPVILDKKTVPVSRVSRFLQQRERNPRAADHCHRDNEICNYIMEGRNTTCCNNKCIYLRYDDNNCGACKKKCAFTETCCRGECVNLAYDKRHCGSCNHKCMEGGFCIYGICDYA